MKENFLLLQLTASLVKCSPDLEIKRAIDSILLCTKDGSQMLSHSCDTRGVLPLDLLGRQVWCASQVTKLVRTEAGQGQQAEAQRTTAQVIKASFANEALILD